MLTKNQVIFCFIVSLADSWMPTKRRILEVLYRPPTKLREGNVFTGVCLLGGGGQGVYQEE